MSFQELAAERYSVRSFSNRPIEPEKIEKVLEAGRIAPTAHNYQPQRIKIITTAEDLAKVDECTPCRYGAPTVFLICFDKTVSWKREFDGECSGVVDSSIVTTHLMFAAQDLGLGSCWVMHFDPVKAIQLFALPDNIVPVAFLPVGYPAEGSVPSKGHGNRMPLQDYLLRP